MDNFTSITDLRWANEVHDIVNFNIKFTNLPEPINYFLGHQDATPFARGLWPRVTGGEWGPIAVWDPAICNLPSIVLPPPPAPSPVTFVDGEPEQPTVEGAKTI
jgi:hypothetical protein